MASTQRGGGPRKRPPRSLCVLLQALVGQKVAVETRAGASMQGVLEHVDRRMNLTMSDVSTPFSSAPYDSLYVAGTHVVFVELPDSVDVGRAIDGYIYKRPFR